MLVTLCRGARYAFIADHYGRHFIRALRHPAKYWGWLLLFAAVVLSLTMAGIAVNRQVAAPTSS
jgi:multisubunit Na+/H+ antiporter MnhE subunit